jgi:hypothetical protein
MVLDHVESCINQKFTEAHDVSLLPLVTAPVTSSESLKVSKEGLYKVNLHEPWQNVCFGFF